MVSMNISSIPDDLHARLREQAVRTGSSIEQVALRILDSALPRIPPLRLPTPIEPLRPITAEEITRAIREGRE